MNDAGDVPLCSCLENGCYGNRLKVGVSVCQFIALQQADYGAEECREKEWEGEGGEGEGGEEEEEHDHQG